MERYRLSSAAYHRMIERGILDEDTRLELIEGELAVMSPIGPEHAGYLKKVAELLFEQLHRRALLSIQDPVHLDQYSEPQPDLALLRPRRDYYTRSLPEPSDIFLVVEVADSSLVYDRTVKAPLYARAGVVEMWIVNLIDGWVEVYRDPSPAGYTTLLKVLPGKSVAPLAFADVTIDVSGLLAGG
jgi:Uma2 family endonuclease